MPGAAVVHALSTLVHHVSTAESPSTRYLLDDVLVGLVEPFPFIFARYSESSAQDTPRHFTGSPSSLVILLQVWHRTSHAVRTRPLQANTAVSCSSTGRKGHLAKGDTQHKNREQLTQLVQHVSSWCERLIPEKGTPTPRCFKKQECSTVDSCIRTRRAS
eukprot:4461020-Amphidinium_carterae.1